MLRGTQAGAEQRGNPNGLQADEAPDDEGFTPLTAEQAQALRARQPQASVWVLVRWQLVMLLLATASSVPFALVWGEWVWVVSVFYGGLCALLPTAVMAYGLTGSRWARKHAAQPAGAVRGVLRGVFFWEGVKILLAIAMLALAQSLIPGLSWVGLLVGLVLVLKVYWLAFWRRPTVKVAP